MTKTKATKLAQDALAEFSKVDSAAARKVSAKLRGAIETIESEWPESPPAKPAAPGE